MKLYNRTRIPDAALKPLLARAARAVGAKSAKVIVFANPTCRLLAGEVEPCFGWHFGERDRFVATHGGVMRLQIT